MTLRARNLMIAFATSLLLWAGAIAAVVSAFSMDGGMVR